MTALLEYLDLVLSNIDQAETLKPLETPLGMPLQKTGNNSKDIKLTIYNNWKHVICFLLHVICP